MNEDLEKRTYLRKDLKLHRDSLKVACIVSIFIDIALVSISIMLMIVIKNSEYIINIWLRLSLMSVAFITTLFSPIVTLGLIVALLSLKEDECDRKLKKIADLENEIKEKKKQINTLKGKDYERD